MKFKVAIVLALILCSAVMVNAQQGNYPQRTVEERMKAVHDKLDSAFKFDAVKQGKIDSAFATYFRQQDKVREELRSGGERPDRETVMAKMRPVVDSRDKELKTILSEAEFKKWKEEIEPAMIQQRRRQQQ